MEIMKVFSSYDDYGYEDERLYSVLMNEEELYLFSEFTESMFSNLEEVKGNRGYGSAILKGTATDALTLGGTLGSGIAAAAGIKAGKKAANKADREGATEVETINAAKKQARKTAGRVGVGIGAIGGAAASYGAGKLYENKKFQDKAVHTARSAAKFLRDHNFLNKAMSGKTIGEITRGSLNESSKHLKSGKGMGMAAAGTALGTAFIARRRAAKGAEKNTLKRLEERDRRDKKNK